MKIITSCVLDKQYLHKQNLSWVVLPRQENCGHSWKRVDKWNVVKSKPKNHLEPITTQVDFQMRLTQLKQDISNQWKTRENPGKHLAFGLAEKTRKISAQSQYSRNTFLHFFHSVVLPLQTKLVLFANTALHSIACESCPYTPYKPVLRWAKWSSAVSVIKYHQKCMRWV